MVYLGQNPIIPRPIPKRGIAWGLIFRHKPNPFRNMLKGKKLNACAAYLLHPVRTQPFPLHAGIAQEVNIDAHSELSGPSTASAHAA